MEKAKTVYTEEDTKKYYDSFSDVYELIWDEQIHTGYFKNDADTLSKAVESMNQYVATVACLKPDSNLLNVGCGRGGTDRFLANNFNINVEGVDISERQIEIAKARAKESGLEDKCKYTISSATKIPFPDGTFDYVLCQESFFHIHDKQKAVLEIKRVLKKHGLVILEDTVLFSDNHREDVIETFGGRVMINDILKPEDYFKLFTEAGFILENTFDVSEHLAKTYHKIVEFIENNKSVLREKIPKEHRGRLDESFGFDISENMVVSRAIGCNVFIFSLKC